MRALSDRFHGRTAKIAGTLCVFGSGLIVGMLVLSNASAEPGEDTPRTASAVVLPNAYVAAASASQESANPTLGSTKPTCIATFRFVSSGLSYEIRCNNVTGVTAAHIHTGSADTANGPIRLTLFAPSSPTGAVNGVLAKGTIPNATIGDVAALKASMGNDNTYFNLHTSANSGGEVRGQITGQRLPNNPFLIVL